MDIIQANKYLTLPLGRQGEHRTRQVIFDVSHMEAKYGSGTVELIFQRMPDDTPYPVAIDRDGALISWTLTSTDTAFAGDHGQCELRYYIGDALVKSKIWTTKVIPSIATPTAANPPIEERGWVEKVLETCSAVKLSVDLAKDTLTKIPVIGAEGNWYIWDIDSGAYKDSGQYSGGREPYIGGNGNWYIGVEDSGISAIGPAGQDGHTPQKGVDYWTNEEKQEFILDVLNALPNAEEVSF